MMGLNNFSVNVSLPNGSNDNNLTNNNNSQQFYVTGGTLLYLHQAQPYVRATQLILMPAEH